MVAKNSSAELRIGVDIGGTFTDFVLYEPQSGRLQTFKILSTPNDPAQAVLDGLQPLPETAHADIIHGSTVATNALLERKGAVTALITTRGFRDVLQIGRQNRPALYDWFADPPHPLVPAELRLEVDERIDHTGAVVRALNVQQLNDLLPIIQQAGVTSVAICLLFSFLYPQHEKALTAELRRLGFFVSPSCEILPAYREYERTSTTCVNAYVTPVLDTYLTHLESALPHARLRVMQSNGGMISLTEARRSGVRCILSGPAGGVVAAQQLAHLALPPTQNDLRLITFDMGGTSTDVSLIHNEPNFTSEALVGGCPIAIPILDIHTIGAGGGSIASVDLGGALRVGPLSAGADPGPACYGRGELPTVTDANLVLGRMLPEHFLGGQMHLDRPRAEAALQALGQQLGMDSTHAALGVIEVVNAHMERALRVISVERGHDPREFTLFSFGGAGGLHAADLARRLGIPRVLISPLASTLSAYGMLAADIARDYTQTVMMPGDSPLSEIQAALTPLLAQAQADLEAEGIPAQEIRITCSLDMRYCGQSYELTIPFTSQPGADFHAAHERMYGYQQPQSPTELVSLRVRAVGQVESPRLAKAERTTGDPSPAYLAHYPVALPIGNLEIPFYKGEALQPGNRLPAPSVVVRSDTVILIGPTDTAEIDEYLNLQIHIGLQAIE